MTPLARGARACALTTVVFFAACGFQPDGSIPVVVHERAAEATPPVAPPPAAHLKVLQESASAPGLPPLSVLVEASAENCEDARFELLAGSNLVDSSVERPAVAGSSRMLLAAKDLKGDGQPTLFVKSQLTVRAHCGGREAVSEPVEVELTRATTATAYAGSQITRVTKILGASDETFLGCRKTATGSELVRLVGGAVATTATVSSPCWTILLAQHGDPWRRWVTAQAQLELLSAASLYSWTVPEPLTGVVRATFGGSGVYAIANSVGDDGSSGIVRLDSSGNLVWLNKSLGGDPNRDVIDPPVEGDSTINVGVRLSFHTAVLRKLDPASGAIVASGPTVKMGTKDIFRVVALRDGGLLTLGETETDGWAVEARGPDGALRLSTILPRYPSGYIVTDDHDGVAMTLGDRIWTWDGLSAAGVETPLPGQFWRMQRAVPGGWLVERIDPVHLEDTGAALVRTDGSIAFLAEDPRGGPVDMTYNEGLGYFNVSIAGAILEVAP